MRWEESAHLIQELLEEIQAQKETLDLETVENLEEILNDLQQNAVKINEHGKRADSIVQGMLLHSRGKSGERQPTDINALLAEDISLAYHGMRAKDTTFNIAIETNSPWQHLITEFEESLKEVEILGENGQRLAEHLRQLNQNMEMEQPNANA